MSWIDIKKQLPLLREEVRILDKYGYEQVAKYDGDGVWDVEEEKSIPVTHWKALPLKDGWIDAKHSLPEVDRRVEFKYETVIQGKYLSKHGLFISNSEDKSYTLEPLFWRYLDPERIS